MEFRSLSLKAFGPFTDHLFEFNQQKGGFYIIYGPNEAGKSSALRALKALLFGIETRTRDNFLHSNEKLRIAGVIRDHHGKELSFIRRKGTKNTLLSFDNEVIDANRLTPFLQGMTSDLFETLFGIDYQTLVQGGREILAQKGEVGEALFATALGSATLHSVLKGFEEEADALFRPRGSTQKINIALKKYQDLSRQIRESSLSSKEWSDHQKELESLNKELITIQNQLDRSRLEIHALQRTERIRPKIGMYRSLDVRFREFGDFLPLAEDFSHRRLDTVKKLEMAVEKFETASAQQRYLNKQSSTFQVSSNILKYETQIENLQQRFGSYKKAMEDRPHREGEKKQLLYEAKALLQEVRPDLALSEVETLRNLLNKQSVIIELGSQRHVLIEGGNFNEETLRELQAKLQERELQFLKIPPLQSTSHLRYICAEARKSGDLESILKENSQIINEGTLQCKMDLQGISLWKGDLENFLDLPLPGNESFQLIEQKYSENDKELHILQTRLSDYKESLHALEQQLQQIQGEGQVPTEQDMISARHGRDETWKKLRSSWKEYGDNLADKFEKEMESSDFIADRLRREADLVQKNSALLAQKEQMLKKILDTREKQQQIQEAKHLLDRTWKDLWVPSNLSPLSPGEMKVWKEKVEKIKEKQRSLLVQQHKTREIQELYIHHSQALHKELSSLKKGGTPLHSLEELLLEAEGKIEQFRQARHTRENLEGEIRRLEQEIKQAEQNCLLNKKKRDLWTKGWSTVIQGLSQNPDIDPSEANDRMKKIKELFLKLDEANKLELRIQGIDKDAKSFRQQLNQLTATVAPDLGPLPLDQEMITLQNRLKKNREDQTRKDQIEKQLRQTQEEIHKAESIKKTMEMRVSQLCEEARESSPSQLEPLEKRSREFRKISYELEAIKKELIDLGEGKDLQTLEVDVDQKNRDEIQQQIQTLQNQITLELEPKKTKVAEEKGRREKEQELMDGNDKAAELSSQAQGVLAEIHFEAEQYSRLKLASAILRKEIEGYREKNQGPLLKRSGEFFNTLTLGSFTSLQTEYNQKDEPLLVGLRPEGNLVHVDGMSSGTRDQLYLSLRLAALEKYMDSMDPMPFIVDDILVHFDDERSAATLQVLADLARKTQVILFTHHSSILEQASKIPESNQPIILKL